MSIHNIIASAKSLAQKMSAFAGLVASVESSESEKLRELLRHLSHQPNISYLWCLFDDVGELQPAHPSGAGHRFKIRDAIEDSEGYIPGELCLARQTTIAEYDRLLDVTPDFLTSQKFAAEDIILVRGKRDIYSISYTAPLDERTRLSENVFRPKPEDDTDAPIEDYWCYSEDTPGAYREAIFLDVALRDNDGRYVTKHQMPECMWPTPNKIAKKGSRTLCYYTPIYDIIDSVGDIAPDAFSLDPQLERAILESMSEAEAAKNRAIESHCNAKAKGDVKFRRSLMPYLPVNGRLARESPEFVKQLRECTQASLKESLELMYEPDPNTDTARSISKVEAIIKFCEPDFGKMRKEILSLSAGKHWYDIITAMLKGKRLMAIQESQIPPEAILLVMVKSAKSQYPFDLDGILLRAVVGGAAAGGAGRL